MRRRPLVPMLVALALLASPAWAQDVPPGQSCGGLLCDMGVIGHKVEAPPPAALVPPPAPVPVAQTPVAPPAAAVTPVPARSRPHLARKAPRPAPRVVPTPVVARAPRPPVAAAAREHAPPPAAAPVYTGPTMIFQSIDPQFQR